MKTKPMTMLLAMLAGWINQQQQEEIEYLKAENGILKDELLKATGKKRIILNNSQRRRLAILGKKLGRKLLGQVCCSFSPDTLIKWHRKLVAQKYTSKNHGKGGRPRISDYLKQLIIYMAKDNKHLGCRKLHGFLKYLGLKVSPATISRILREHGIEPSPDRPERTSWNEFIKAHWESLAAIDFFTTEIYTIRGLVRYRMSFDALLRASIINDSGWLGMRLVLESKFGLQRGLGLMNSVKKVSIATCKPLLKSLCFSFIHLSTTCNPHFWAKNAL